VSQKKLILERETERLYREICQYSIDEFNRLSGGEFDFKPRIEKDYFSLRHQGLNYIFNFSFSAREIFFEATAESFNGAVFSGNLNQYLSFEGDEETSIISGIEAKIIGNDFKMKCKIKEELTEEEKPLFFKEIFKYLIKRSIQVAAKLSSKN
jgi:uncharacterized UBP type Zn finger protein